MPASVALLVAILAAQQAAHPLRKSDLIRLLATPTLAPAEVAEIVRRNCLSFAPSPRDKADLRALGADDALLRRVEECARRAATLRATARVQDAMIVAGARTVVHVDVRRGEEPAGGVHLVLRGSGRVTGGPDLEGITDGRGRLRVDLPSGGALGTHRLSIATARGDALENPPTVEVTVRPAPVVATPSRTGFVSGLGQRGRVGTRLALPLVFEARDTANAPVIGHAVALRATNARLEGAGTTTDSSGRVRTFVVLGSQAGTARVTATLGRIDREATLVAVAGPPARLVLRCASETIEGRVRLPPGASLRLDVAVTDAHGNAVALTGLRVSVGDEAIVRAELPSRDSAPGGFALRARSVGATNLVVLGSGLRESLVAAVSKDSGTPPCRGGGPGG